MAKRSTKTVDSKDNSANTVYVVSAYDKPHWRTLLSTKDKDAAEALKASIEADGVRAKIEAFPPARSSPSPKTPG